MLVLRRKIGETLVIDNSILVTVLAVEGERVKLGIQAPPAISLMREELLRAPLPSTLPQALADIAQEEQGTQKGEHPNQM